MRVKLIFSSAAPAAGADREGSGVIDALNKEKTSERRVCFDQVLGNGFGGRIPIGGRVGCTPGSDAVGLVLEVCGRRGKRGGGRGGREGGKERWYV